MWAMFLRAAAPLAVVFSLSACGGEKKEAAAPSGPCTNVVKEDVKMAGRTGVEGAKTGVAAGVEGVKAAGGATAGLFKGGTDEAKERWREGKEKTRATAREHADQTSSAAHSSPCK
jgi:hypothetical protein